MAWSHHSGPPLPDIWDDSWLVQHPSQEASVQRSFYLSWPAAGQSSYPHCWTASGHQGGHCFGHLLRRLVHQYSVLLYILGDEIMDCSTLRPVNKCFFQGLSIALRIWEILCLDPLPFLWTLQGSWEWVYNPASYEWLQLWKPAPWRWLVRWPPWLWPPQRKICYNSMMWRTSEPTAGQITISCHLWFQVADIPTASWPAGSWLILVKVSSSS